MRVSGRTAIFIAILTVCAVKADRSPNENATTTLTLEDRIEIEENTSHWTPYKRILYHENPNGSLVEKCWERPKAIDEFPKPLWDRKARLHGPFVIHFFTAIYLFIALAMICDKYFIPSVERICEVLNISQDIAASTFMATATTIPEFFNNTISTFVAESDMGLSAIVGSMMFNTLVVAALASLFAAKPIQIDWWPITRDSIMFSFNISVLVAICWDGVVMWYESIVFIILYVDYWFFMFQNPSIMKCVKNLVENRLMWCQRIKHYDIANQCEYNPEPRIVSQIIVTSPDITISEADDVEEIEDATLRTPSTINAGSPSSLAPPQMDDRRKSTDLLVIYLEESEEDFKVWEIPSNVGKFSMLWYFFTWPLRFLFHYTIPDATKYPKFFALTFMMCIAWIGGLSYMIFWMVVLLGDTFGISDPIMGLTFLAFGGCMPEAISAIIIARKGSGQMGVSNALGANSFAVLFSLGIPWFIRTMYDGARFGFDQAYIRIFTDGIEFTIMGLLLAVATLYITLAIAGFRMKPSVGIVLALGYCVLATTAILEELHIFRSKTQHKC